MRLARLLPLLLLCAPLAARAQDAIGGQEAVEMKCVYAAMSEAEHGQLARADSGRIAPDEVDAANDLVLRNADACATRHGWDAELTLAGGGYAIARSVFEGALAALPQGLDPAALEAAAAMLSDEDRYRFTSAGKAELGIDPAWRGRVDAALSAAGVAPANNDAAVLYLEVLHDALYATQVFHELWVAKHR